jgi:hypothetical protein
MSPELCRGIVYGFILAGIIGFLLNRIRHARARTGQMRQPLDTFPDAAQPGLTPLGIVRKGTCSMFACAFWLVLLLVVLGGASYSICLNCEELPGIAQYFCNLIDWLQQIQFPWTLP